MSSCPIQFEIMRFDFISTRDVTMSLPPSVEAWSAGKQGGDGSSQTDRRERQPAQVRDRPGVSRRSRPDPWEAAGEQRQLWV